MLTNAAVKAARPRPCAYKLFDERGLFLFVAPTGLKAWRMRCRINGREQLLSLGRWPDLALDEARTRADRARALIQQGIDPRATCGEQQDTALRFEAVARAWHADRRPRWSDRHADDVLASLERDVFPALGGRAIASLGAAELLALVGGIERRGAHETARRVRQRLDMIFRYAAVRNHVVSNPAVMIADELQAAPAQRHLPALTTIEEARGLLADCEAIDLPRVVKSASRLLALTAVRMGALLGARWDEIEQLDSEAPLWRIPAERMKLRKAKKAEAANDHFVPLSPPAAELLRAFRQNGYDTRSSLIFPIGAGDIGALYKRAGYAGRHVPHGWRATFSTILNEAFPEDRFVIDQALAHAPKGKVEAAYNRAAMLERRRDLYRRWAELIMPT